MDTAVASQRVREYPRPPLSSDFFVSTCVAMRVKRASRATVIQPLPEYSRAALEPALLAYVPGALPSTEEGNPKVTAKSLAQTSAF